MTDDDEFAFEGGPRQKELLASAERMVELAELERGRKRRDTLDLLRQAGGERAQAVFCRNEQDWLDVRKEGVGSSEVAALFGLCPDSWAHGTPLKLYAHKLGLAPPVDASDAMLLGKLQEPVVSRMTEIKMPGIRIFAPPPHTVFRLKGAPRVMASIDRLTQDEDGVRILELKTADFFTRDQWEYEDGEPCVPMHYEMQVQAQMHVLGAKRARLAAMVGRNFLPPFDIAYEPEVGKEIERRVAAFWRCVEEKRPPTATDKDFEAVAWIHPNGKAGKVISLKKETAALVAEWDAHRVEKKKAERAIEAIKVQFGELMQDAEIANVVGDRRVHWKNQRKVTPPHPIIPEVLALLTAIREGKLDIEAAWPKIEVAISELTIAAVPKVWEGRVMMPPYLKID